MVIMVSIQYIHVYYAFRTPAFWCCVIYFQSPKCTRNLKNLVRSLMFTTWPSKLCEKSTIWSNNSVNLLPWSYVYFLRSTGPCFCFSSFVFRNFKIFILGSHERNYHLINHLFRFSNASLLHATASKSQVPVMRNYRC